MRGSVGERLADAVAALSTLSPEQRAAVRTIIRAKVETSFVRGLPTALRTSLVIRRGETCRAALNPLNRAYACDCVWDRPESDCSERRRWLLGHDGGDRSSRLQARRRIVRQEWGLHCEIDAVTSNNDR
jgi:hypothetical protein